MQNRNHLTTDDTDDTDKGSASAPIRAIRAIRGSILCCLCLLLFKSSAFGQTTVQIPAGVYASFKFQSNTTYSGAGLGKTIFRNAGTADYTYSAQLIGLTNVTIDGVSFDANGIDVENCSNVRLRNFEVTNARRAKGNHQGIYFGGLSGCTFENFNIRNCSAAIQGYGGTNLAFRNWRIESCSYGFKWGVNGLNGAIVENGVLDHIRAAMGLEFQGDQLAGSGLIVRKIAYVNPELWQNDIGDRNGNAMAFSIPSSILTGTLAELLYADGNAFLVGDDGKLTGERRISSVGWRGLRVGGEVAGIRPEWRNCWFKNLNDPGAVTTSVDANCHDIRVENCVENFDNAVGAKNPTYTNIGPAVQLPVDGGWTLVGVESGVGGGVSPATQPSAPNSPPLTPNPPPATGPSTSYADDPIIEIRAMQKSGKVTVTKPQ